MVLRGMLKGFVFAGLIVGLVLALFRMGAGEFSDDGWILWSAVSFGIIFLGYFIPFVTTKIGTEYPEIGKKCKKDKFFDRFVMCPLLNWMKLNIFNRLFGAVILFLPVLPFTFGFYLDSYNDWTFELFMFINASAFVLIVLFPAFWGLLWTVLIGFPMLAIFLPFYIIYGLYRMFFKGEAIGGNEYEENTEKQDFIDKVKKGNLDD